MVGIMSLMDALLDRPMELVLSQLPLTVECKDALRGGNHALGKLLQLAIHCEHGEWQKISNIATERGLPEDKIWDTYREACRWSSGILRENDEKR